MGTALRLWVHHGSAIADDSGILLKFTTDVPFKQTEAINNIPVSLTVVGNLYASCEALTHLRLSGIRGSSSYVYILLKIEDSVLSDSTTENLKVSVHDLSYSLQGIIQCYQRGCCCCTLSNTPPPLLSSLQQNLFQVWHHLKTKWQDFK